MVRVNDVMKLAASLQKYGDGFYAKWGVKLYGVQHEYGKTNIQTGGPSNIVDLDLAALCDKLAKELSLPEFDFNYEAKEKRNAGSKGAETKALRKLTPETRAQRAVKMLREISNYRFDALAVVVGRGVAADRVTMHTYYQGKVGAAVNVAKTLPMGMTGEWFLMSGQAESVADSELVGPQPAFKHQRAETRAALNGLAVAVAEQAAATLRLPEFEGKPESGVSTAKKVERVEIGTYIIMAGQGEGVAVKPTTEVKVERPAVVANMASLL